MRKWTCAIAVLGLLTLTSVVQAEPAAKAPAAVEKAATAEKPAAAATKWPALKSGPAAAEAAPAEEPLPDLGAPLVERPERLIALHPKVPIYVDRENKQVVLVGLVCQREVPLELFACLRNTKEHEAIVCLFGRAQWIHAGLIAVGAEPGSTAHFHPQFTPATGQVVEIEVRWRDGGEVRKARAQEWVRNSHTKKAMTEHWIFAGSGLWTHPETKERFYQAEGGDVICLSNFPGAMLDVETRSSSVNEDLSYEAFTANIPPKRTPVTLILTPQKAKK